MCATQSPPGIGHLLCPASHATTLRCDEARILTSFAGDSDFSRDDFSRDWDAVRAQGEIQFAPVEIPVEAAPPPPDMGWLGDFLDWLGRVFGPAGNFIGNNFTVIAWGLGALVVALLLYALARLIGPLKLPTRSEGDEPELAVDQTQARLLLDEADRLAAEGRYDEATHMLLMRSVRQIADLRPDLIEPSSTAREISVLGPLPAKARHAFATIAERVERSLFALQSLSAEDWQAARAAYADFALGYPGVIRGETA